MAPGYRLTRPRQLSTSACLLKTLCLVLMARHRSQRWSDRGRCEPRRGGCISGIQAAIPAPIPSPPLGPQPCGPTTHPTKTFPIDSTRFALTRFEDTTMFGLIEYVQIARNLKTYQKGVGGSKRLEGWHPRGVGLIGSLPRRRCSIVRCRPANRFPLSIPSTLSTTRSPCRSLLCLVIGFSSKRAKVYQVRSWLVAR